MLDREKDIRAQAMLKSIWEGFNHSLNDPSEAILERVEVYLKRSLVLIEMYAKLDEETLKKLEETPLESVSRHANQAIKGNTWKKANSALKYEFCSEKQANRAYAIWKEAGWDDKEVKNWMFDKYGIDNTKRIPSSLYEEICKTLAYGPPES